MTPLVDVSLTKSFPAAPWLFQPAGPDAVAVLVAALGPEWTVERETHRKGDTAIIVLSAREPEDGPSFILYERDGQARLATMQGDDWQREQRFARFASRKQGPCGDQRFNDPFGASGTGFRGEVFRPTTSRFGWRHRRFRHSSARAGQEYAATADWRRRR